MGKLILIRHGESEANRQKVFAKEDTPLTDAGRQQALDVAGKIAGRFRPAAIVSSELVRARQTAEIVAGELSMSIDVVAGLHECDFGILKGQSYQVFRDMVAKDPTYNAARPWTWIPEAGESTEQTQCRVIPVLDELRARYPNDEILVVCHGMVMVAVWAHLHGKWEGADVPPNCAVVVIEHEGDRMHPPVLVEDCQNIA